MLTKSITLMVKAVMKLPFHDNRNNHIPRLLLKTIFGALRPWWQSAYDTQLNGNDFNLPELHPDYSQNPLRGFEDKHHEILNIFCTVIAKEFGYVNSDEEWNNEPDDEYITELDDGTWWRI